MRELIPKLQAIAAERTASDKVFLRADGAIPTSGWRR
jgi:hypothetical protein